MLNYKHFFLSTQAQRIPRFLDLTYILCKLQTNTLPGWTGFNATVQVELLLRSTIGYLQIIDSSPTSYDTVNTILHKSVEICGKLGLEEIVVVFDQAIYAKAQQIRWHNPECSKRIFIRLGDFHTAISYLSCIGKMYRDAGLEEIMIQAEVVATGSINGVMNGHHYSRSVRAHKIVAEALSRIRWNLFVWPLNGNG